MSDHRESAIRIDISGTTHSGKSQLAAKIAHVLHEGFTRAHDGKSPIDVEVYNTDGDFLSVMSRMQDNDFALNRVTAMRVVIMDRNLPFVDPEADKIPHLYEERAIINARSHPPSERKTEVEAPPMQRLQEMFESLGMEASVIRIPSANTFHYHLRIIGKSESPMATSPVGTDFVFDYQGQFVQVLHHHLDH